MRGREVRRARKSGRALRLPLHRVSEAILLCVRHLLRSPRTQFRVLQGEPGFWSRRTNSGHKLDCAFCPDCGSRLWHQSSGHPGTLNIKGGTFDEPRGSVRSRAHLGGEQTPGRRRAGKRDLVSGRADKRVASTVATALPGGRSMKTIDHLILKVNDLEASVAFYRNVLGFVVEGRDGPFTVLRVQHAGFPAPARSLRDGRHGALRVRALAGGVRRSLHADPGPADSHMDPRSTPSAMKRGRIGRESGSQGNGSDGLFQRSEPSPDRESARTTLLFPDRIC